MLGIAVMLKKGFDAMKYLNVKKSKRIALISLAASLLFMSAGPSLTSFAAVQNPVYVTYNGTANTLQAGDSGAIFQGLMPGGTSDQQNVVIRNQSSNKMRVYFQAQPGTDTEKVKALLDTLVLNVTFKMDDGSSTKVLYQGPASGKTGTADIVTDQILLGTVNANSETGIISASIHAPETMGNEFASATANLQWVLQLEAVASPESIGEESTPLVNPSSTPAESIGEESTPQASPTDLTQPPKTGQDPRFIWIVLIAALVSVAAIVIVQGKRRSAQKK
ncbi:MAG: hypothetical protein GX424_10835 [Clostridiales bacterium]|nr:hypothetical protein [Clostridiales bacterium]